MARFTPLTAEDATQGWRCNGLAGDLPVTECPGDDGYAYDVFVSYRHQDPDGSWVRGVLVERLHAAGLRVFVDYESFRLGAPLVLEMARGVEQSRYTLAVLSPAYLASNFGELENVLAEHLGLELSQRRLLAVRRVPCRPRLGVLSREVGDTAAGWLAAECGVGPMMVIAVQPRWQGRPADGF
jgi:hypothetical protein